MCENRSSFSDGNDCNNRFKIDNEKYLTRKIQIIQILRNSKEASMFKKNRIKRCSKNTKLSLLEMLNPQVLVSSNEIENRSCIRAKKAETVTAINHRKNGVAMFLLKGWPIMREIKWFICK